MRNIQFLDVAATIDLFTHLCRLATTMTYFVPDLSRVYTGKYTFW